MASLNKLAIRGIRSFDDKQISIIEFFSPVTVIVGHNGSGKTTIIECLKYATTGDQPANTRGGAFVHDPKMANEKEVKAQVKLRFHAANGTRMLAIRNLSVSVKKNSGLTMKTLESVLGLADGNADKGGKRGVISTKCAEMDAEIPQLLGVSKAVLDNVIFCHQEDSYWPLAEASALKKKFDDIFEATRYTKALDSIKSLRKDRVAELKAEQERLVGLAREKDHADKLKRRITELNNNIASKEVEYEGIKKEYNAMAIANQKFYDNATKFREIYMTTQNLEETASRIKADLDEAKLNMQEITGTDEELKSRLQHFDDHINSQKQKKRTEDIKKQDLEDELVSTRKFHTELVVQHGRLQAEAEAQKQRIAEREQLIHEICEKHSIKGYNHSPLEREKVLEFLSKLGDVQRKQKTELEKLQGDVRTKTEEYNRKFRQLDNAVEGHKLQKKHLRDQIVERQSSINFADRKLEQQQSLPSDLRALQGDIQEKKLRLEGIKQEIKAAKYEVFFAETTDKSRLLEAKRDSLNNEIRAISLQADTRARLDLKKAEVKNKTTEIQTILGSDNTKYRILVPKSLTADNMEDIVADLQAETEKEQASFEGEVTSANSNLQSAETSLTSLKSEERVKAETLKELERKLKTEVDQDSLESAIKEAFEEIDHRKTLVGSMLGTSSVYENILKVGKQKKLCSACNRQLDDRELVAFEKYLKDLIKKAAPGALQSSKAEMVEWETELERLQKLRPIQAARDQLKSKELPALEAQIFEQQARLPGIMKQAEEASAKLDMTKRQMKDILILKQHAETVSRLRKEIERAKQDISSLEEGLTALGSTKTADEVQAELDNIGATLRTIEREKQTLTLERDRQTSTTRNLETSLHQMELNEKDLLNDIREKSTLEGKVQQSKEDIISFTNQLKGIDALISEAQAPIDTLDGEQRQMQIESNAKISQTQSTLQELNMSVDKLNVTNKGVERYVKEKRARELEDCATRIESRDNELRDLTDQIEGIRQRIAGIDKEINESGASVANLRENIRVRKLMKDIQAIQAEISSYDMEEAAKARRNFEEKYQPAKDKENELNTAASHTAGEVSSLKSQLKALESDLKEFKEVYKNYTDQLIRVKVSDMANSDLEKYAKALDNAIMKYHGLKMEEVNDTMKHLWNKTYQGTDIDGIKIRSDVEGGASKRSYNYRVVMTKDQVEMDMRGRCSAGQKMLASIIIRLALSDSFGQNCGILALDEPTNALDTENIDALAASLVDIINERKSHSNFQLIIITHDENFLRKLGQSDVMEYYWRVSRDVRQKSVIERQRFR